jgi:hypothetical protein
MSKCSIFVFLLFGFYFTNLQAQTTPRVFSGKLVSSPDSPSLDSILSAYHVYDLEASALKAHLQSESGDEKQFILELPGLGAWPVALTARPLLSSSYQLQVDDGQQITKMPGPGQITWAGHLAGEISQRVSLTVNENFIFGTIQTPSGEYFIEPLRDLEPNAPKDRFIVYKTTDVLPNPNLRCGVTEVSQKKSESDLSVGERQVGLCKHVELAIASDFGMFTRYTNAAGVETHNIGVMNEVATDYDDAFDDEIYFLIVTQYVSSTSTSSLDVALTATTNADVLLPNFRTWGNAGNFGVTFDDAQLWVTRDICTPAAGCGVIGIAYRPGMCGNNRYHLLEDFTGYNPSGSGWQLRVLTSHEIGHNFSCMHDPAGSGTIMSPSVNNTTTWSAQSVAEVGAYLPTISCLATCGVNFLATSYTTSEFVSNTYLPAGAPSCEMGYTELLIPVQYSGPASGGSVTVSVAGGSATENLDFSLPSTTINFPAGSTSQTVDLTVRIWNDAISESNETIDLELDGALAGSQNTTTVTIFSDDFNPATSYYTLGQIGTGNAGGIYAPFHGAFQDCRTQIVLGASELSSAGFVANDIINGVALEVTTKNSTQPYNGFTIKMKHTAAAPNSTGQPESSGFTTVYTANHSTSTGWNKFNFTQGFVWDGTSNVRVEFCYDNSSVTNNDLVRTSNGAATVFVEANSGSGCTLPTNSWFYWNNNRPNIRLYKGNDIAITLGDESDTNLENGETAYFKDAQNEFVLTIKQTSGADASCVNVEIDRAGNGRQTPAWLPPGYYISDKTFFVTADNSSGTYEVTLYYSNAEVAIWGAVANSLNIIKSSVPIASADASNSSINEAITRSTFGPSNAYYSYKGTFTGFSGFAVTNATQSLLPVEWLDFTGKLIGENTLLTWTTAAEQDNKGFDVERSFDGGSFEKIGFVEGRGTVSQPQPYHFEDKKVLGTKVPVLYYRLKQIDTDGKFSYSKIVSVQLPGAEFAWQLLPNPTSGEVILQKKDCRECLGIVSLTDAAGREALRQQISGESNTLDLSRLPSGIYFVTVRGDDGGLWQTRLVRL